MYQDSFACMYQDSFALGWGWVSRGGNMWGNAKVHGRTHGLGWCQSTGWVQDTLAGWHGVHWHWRRHLHFFHVFGEKIFLNATRRMGEKKGWVLRLIFHKFIYAFHFSMLIQHEKMYKAIEFRGIYIPGKFDDPNEIFKPCSTTGERWERKGFTSYFYAFRFSMIM